MNSNSYVYKYTLLYTYNDRGLLDKEQTLEDGIATYKELYLYDTEGKMIEKQRYHQKDTLCYTTVFSYNEAGLVREDTVRFPLEDAMRKDRNEYLYNDKGYLVEKKRYDNTGLLTQDTYKYDTLGRRTYYYHLISKEDKDFWEERYEYNKHDDLIQLIYRIPEGEYSRKYVYTYDKQGNWITRAMYHKDKQGERLEEFIRRSIEYH